MTWGVVYYRTADGRVPTDDFLDRCPDKVEATILAVPPGVPPRAMHAVISDKLSARYVAEFHSGILDELVMYQPDWVATVALGSGDPPRSHPLGKAIADLNFQDLGASDLMVDTDQMLRSFVYKAFNRDLVMACDLDATFSVTSLFAPMLERRGLAAHHVGEQALALVVPNIGELPWEAVGEFRDHPGSREARDMLREFEAMANAEESEDAYAWLQSVSQQVTGAYAAALAATAKSLPEELAKQALLTGVAFIPAVGPAVEKSAAITETLREVMRERRTWAAALWQLRR